MDETARPPSDLLLEIDFEVDGSRSPDVPMLEMTIKLFGWGLGQAELDTKFSDVLGGPFGAAPPGDAGEVFGRLHARLQEEIAEAFEIFRRCPRG